MFSGISHAAIFVPNVLKWKSLLVFEFLCLTFLSIYLMYISYIVIYSLDILDR